MTQVSIKNQVKRLVELQKLDYEIFNFKKELEEKPAIIEQLKSEFEETKAHLLILEEKSKKIQLARKENELELKIKEESIAKANAQLSQIKTNKEYAAKLSEIESIKADKSIVEEKILILYDQGDVVNAEITKEKAAVADKEKVFLTRKKEIDDQIKITQDRVVVLQSQRKHITPEVDKNYLSRYEMILLHKEGRAIVPVKDNTCGGCYMNANQQVINAIKMHDKLIECEMCSRILYLEDDL